MKNSGFKTIAERYVRALFEVAQSASALDEVAADLASLGAALSESVELQQFLSNPLLSRETQAEAFGAILAKMDAHKVTQQFITMLAAQKRLPALPAIVLLFAQWMASARGELNAELIAAAPLKDKEIAMVSDRLSKVYGKKVNLEVRQNPELLGGVIVKIGSVQMDSSLAGKLNRLALALKAA